MWSLSRLTLVIAVFLLIVSSKRISGEELSWKYEYDQWGALVALEPPDGQAIEYSAQKGSTGLAEQVTIGYPDAAQVSLGFDSLGRRVLMSDELGEVRYKYNTDRRLESVQRKDFPGLGFEYDSDHRLVSLTIESHLTLKYTYDQHGHCNSIRTPAGTFGLSYVDSTGRARLTYPNGLVSLRAYDHDGSLQHISHMDAEGEVLGQFGYTYQPAGRIDSIVTGGPERAYFLSHSYDTEGRLVRVNDSRGYHHVYRYDDGSNVTHVIANGNVVMRAEYDWIGRPEIVNGQPASYDLNGNVTSMMRHGGVAAYEYGSNGALKAAGVGGRSVRFLSDGNGLPIRRQIDQQETRFLSDPRVESFRPLAILKRGEKPVFCVWHGDLLLMTIQGSHARYYMHDHLGSIRIVADKRGRLQEFRQYSPLGKPLWEIDTEDIIFGFAGMVYDPAAEVYYAGLRVYDPGLGQFLQLPSQLAVPDGQPETVNLYSYCGNDPVNYVDRSGRTRRAVMHKHGLCRESLRSVCRGELGSRLGLLPVTWNPTETAERNATKNGLWPSDSCGYLRLDHLTLDPEAECPSDTHGHQDSMVTLGVRRLPSGCLVIDGHGSRESNLNETEASQSSEQHSALCVFHHNFLQSISWYDGGLEEFFYDTLSQGERVLRTTRSSSGRVVSYEYDDLGRVRKVVCGQGYSLDCAYESSGRLAALTLSKL